MSYFLGAFVTHHIKLMMLTVNANSEAEAKTKSFTTSPTRKEIKQTKQHNVIAKLYQLNLIN